jgi:hypothetical protein
MKNILFLGALSLCVISCERQDNKVNYPTSTNTGTNSRDSDWNTQTSRDQSIRENEKNPRDYSSDNTGINVRDRDFSTKTAGDQSEKASDRMISSNLRASLMKDDSLSTYAKNVKIITINGVVTLRGPVNNATEKEKIGNKAMQISGVQNVENFLEVAPTR